MKQMCRIFLYFMRFPVQFLSLEPLFLFLSLVVDSVSRGLIFGDAHVCISRRQ